MLKNKGIYVWHYLDAHYWSLTSKFSENLKFIKWFQINF